jgi:hypothetical protein
MGLQRFFAFGCSFTKCWEYPTWADYIGAEFEVYRNFGMPGSSNGLIMQRFVESDVFYKFNSETDFVMIAISGLGRYAFPVTVDGRDRFYSRGDFESKQDSSKDTQEVRWNFNFVKSKFWKKRYSVFDSFMAVKIMKDILSARGIRHKIIAGLDYKVYLEHGEVYGINDQLKSYILMMQEMLDVKESINEFDGFNSGHPSQETYYKFAEKHFPELLGDESLRVLNTDYGNEYINKIKEVNPDIQDLNEDDGGLGNRFVFNYF